jgi:hypothetical protein
MSQTQQAEQEQAINLGTSLNIGATMGSLLDLQQLVRSVPNILAQLNEKDAKIAELSARLASLEPKVVAPEAKAVAE